MLTTRTDEFFAWTIAVPASAAFIGVFYLAAAVMGVLALRQPLWAPARASLLPVMVFVGIVLLVTLLDLQIFHLTAGVWSARVAAWVWLAVYVLTPPAYLLAFRVQARAPGSDPPRTAPLPRPVRTSSAVAGVLLALAGGALLVVPGVIGPLWPWELTRLTARMVGATLLGVALLAASVARTDDRGTGRIAPSGWWWPA